MKQNVVCVTPCFVQQLSDLANHNISESFAFSRKISLFSWVFVIIKIFFFQVFLSPVVACLANRGAASSQRWSAVQQTGLSQFKNSRGFAPRGVLNNFADFCVFVPVAFRRFPECCAGKWICLRWWVHLKKLSCFWFLSMSSYLSLSSLCFSTCFLHLFSAKPAFSQEFLGVVSFSLLSFVHRLSAFPTYFLFELSTCFLFELSTCFLFELSTCFLFNFLSAFSLCFFKLLFLWAFPMCFLFVSFQPPFFQLSLYRLSLCDLSTCFLFQLSLQAFSFSFLYFLSPTWFLWWREQMDIILW